MAIFTIKLDHAGRMWEGEEEGEEGEAERIFLRPRLPRYRVRGLDYHIALFRTKPRISGGTGLARSILLNYLRYARNISC